MHMAAGKVCRTRGCLVARVERHNGILRQQATVLTGNFPRICRIALQHFHIATTKIPFEFVFLLKMKPSLDIRQDER